jgi:hypothetical protein
VKLLEVAAIPNLSPVVQSSPVATVIVVAPAAAVYVSLEI